jgi:nucleotide-binding universal stress UspA family protein
MRVLLCVDDDLVLKDVLAAMEWSVDLPAWNDVVILHVAPRHPTFLLGSDAAPERRGEALLKRVRERLSPLRLGVRSVLAAGDPAQEIVRTAEEAEADLIVMGALGARRDFLLGSVSQKVASVAPTDVLVVRERSSRGDEIRDRRRAFRTVVAVDGSLGSEAAIDSFARKLRARHASTRVVHVVESLPALWDAPRERTGVPDAFGDLDRLDLRSREVLVRARESLASRGLDVECEQRRGSPAGQILEAAREFGADVIVVGSRGHSAIRDVVLGSITKRVLRHAPCTVLCARGWAFESGSLSRDWTSRGWEPEVGMA